MKQIDRILLYTFAISKPFILQWLSITVFKRIYQMEVRKHALTFVFFKKRCTVTISAFSLQKVLMLLNNIFLF